MIKLRAAQSGGRSSARLKLDADIARRRYETLSAKRADAEMLYKIERRQQGPALELLEPPPLPNEWRPSVLLFAFGGLIAGGLMGVLVCVLVPSRAAQPAMQLPVT
jgi:uncharacterized protein involved in exopolysaccharide biosynthesis